MILQCEQGVDYFVPRGRLGTHVIVAPFLQDNYEDWMMFYEGMLHVRKRLPSQMWLLQTNPDLDIGRGISRLELQHEVFGQELKCEAFQQCLQCSDEQTLISVAVSLGKSDIQQRHKMFNSLGMQLSNLGQNCANEVYNGIYQDFTSFCMKSSDSPAVPVASVLELLTKLIQNEKIGLKDGQSVPECEWMVARHLEPKDIKDGNLRVWNDLDEIFRKLPEKSSTARWIHELQYYRRHKHGDAQTPSLCELPEDASKMVGERAAGEMVDDLSIALCVAKSILHRCRAFDLWKDPELLLRCLQRMGTHSSDQQDGGIKDDRASIFLFLRSNPMQTLDFVCRFLEWPHPQAAADYISKHFLPERSPNNDMKLSWMWPAFKQLETYIIEEWEKLDVAPKSGPIG